MKVLITHVDCNIYYVRKFFGGNHNFCTLKMLTLLCNYSFEIKNYFMQMQWQRLYISAIEHQETSTEIHTKQIGFHLLFETKKESWLWTHYHLYICPSVVKDIHKSILKTNRHTVEFLHKTQQRTIILYA